MTLTAPGVYDIPEDQYHADPCPEPSLSCSIMKVLLNRSPRHAWFAHPRLNPAFTPETKSAFDLGSAAHALVLGDRQLFRIIEADNYKTKAAQEAKAEAYADRLIPLLPHQHAQVSAMAAAARAQLAAHQDAADAFTDGKPEQTLIWREGVTWCRARLDWLPNTGRVFRDYKTTAASANPDAFDRQVFDLGYDIQAAFYRRGIAAVLDIRDPVFELVVQETEPPYALSVIGLSPGILDMAERKIDTALELWRWCLKNDTWPGYPARTAYIEVPAYHEAKWLNREARDGLAREGGDRALFETLMQWQSPL